MAGYGTDLNTLTDAESGTWVELTNYAQGGAPSADGENFIQGSDCRSQTTGQKAGAVFSIMYNNGSALTWTSGDVFFIWQYFSVGADLVTYASGGMRVGIFSSLTAGDIFYTGGNDRSPYPYGAWQNVAVDPENTTNEVTDNGGNGGNYQYIGSLTNITLKITKGTPHACDAIRYGRGELYCTGTTANFTGMSTYNDYNDVTNGYNRFGLFRDTGGNTFIWKGQLSFGQSGISTTFTDSNKTILIDDAAKTYESFNKIAIYDTGSTITWTNISFTALGTTSPGDFEMIDNATVNLNSCVFTDMNTFIFQSGATLNNTTFRGCTEVTQSGATFTNCIFDNANISSSGVTLYVDDISNITDCDFTSSDTGHAIEGFPSAGEYDLDGLTFTDYFTGATGNSGDEAVYVTATSGIVNLNVTNGDTDFSIRTAGATVNIVANPVTVSITAKNTDGDAIENARGYIYAVTGGTLPAKVVVTITGDSVTATTTHTSHGLFTNDKVNIYGSDIHLYNGVQTITVVDNDTYTYIMDSAPGSDPSTTTYSTFVALEGLTNSSGSTSTIRVYSVDQPIKGWVRKASTSPKYKTSTISDTISSTEGFSPTIIMVSDE